MPRSSTAGRRLAFLWRAHGYRSQNAFIEALHRPTDDETVHAVRNRVVAWGKGLIPADQHVRRLIDRLCPDAVESECSDLVRWLKLGGQPPARILELATTPELRALLTDEPRDPPPAAPPLTILPRVEGAAEPARSVLELIDEKVFETHENAEAVLEKLRAILETAARAGVFKSARKKALAFFAFAFLAASVSEASPINPNRANRQPNSPESSLNHLNPLFGRFVRWLRNFVEDESSESLESLFKALSTEATHMSSVA